MSRKRNNMVVYEGTNNQGNDYTVKVRFHEAPGTRYMNKFFTTLYVSSELTIIMVYS